MAGPSLTCCARGYCTGAPHNRQPWPLHCPRLFSIAFTKFAEEPTNGVHLTEAAVALLAPDNPGASATISANRPYSPLSGAMNWEPHKFWSRQTGQDRLRLMMSSRKPAIKYISLDPTMNQNTLDTNKVIPTSKATRRQPQSLIRATPTAVK